MQIGRIDPDGSGDLSRNGGTFHKALGVFQISGMQNLLTLVQNGLSSSIMNIGGRQQSDGAVMMLVVVPAEEFCRPSPGIGLATKTGGIV
jgi:hypothetical protein